MRARLALLLRRSADRLDRRDPTLCFNTRLGNIGVNRVWVDGAEFVRKQSRVPPRPLPPRIRTDDKLPPAAIT